MNKSQVPTAQNFGNLFRLKRIALGSTLRAFCERYGYDPGNISRLERNILPPTLDDGKLAGYATALKITRDTEEWVLFYDLAHTAKGKLPSDIKNDQEISNLLPAFFRTMRNKKLDKNKLEKLVELLKK
jgi:transcriptional regulator with XRE-family HTH domain